MNLLVGSRAFELLVHHLTTRPLHVHFETRFVWSRITTSSRKFHQVWSKSQLYLPKIIKFGGCHTLVPRLVSSDFLDARKAQCTASAELLAIGNLGRLHLQNRRILGIDVRIWSLLETRREFKPCRRGLLLERHPVISQLTVEIKELLPSVSWTDLHPKPPGVSAHFNCSYALLNI